MHVHLFCRHTLSFIPPHVMLWHCASDVQALPTDATGVGVGEADGFGVVLAPGVPDGEGEPEGIAVGLADCVEVTDWLDAEPSFTHV